MISDEEKKAIEFLKVAKELKIVLSCSFWNNGEFEFNKLQKQQFDTILKLIEKQQKEIEQLKEKNGVLQNELNKKTEALDKAMNNPDYISKNKIKVKIEEVEQWELYNMKIPKLSTLDERLGAKIGIKYVLQSLLDKE